MIFQVLGVGKLGWEEAGRGEGEWDMGLLIKNCTLSKTILSK